MVEGKISHYRILAKIGEGGMGEVYRVEDTSLRCVRALKFLAPRATNNSYAKLRFLREARTAAALNHPAICTIHEIDEADGQVFIAMEHLEGQNLKERLESGPLDLDEFLRVAIQVTEGLQEAHQHDIVHRDLKPANIIITRQGYAKILDFGLAVLADETRLTQDGFVPGTLHYMAPEQQRGEHVDARTDLWSLGVVLYEAITGHQPFRDRGDREEYLPPSSLRATLPPQLDHILRQAMEQDPDDRYQSAAELARDLRHLRHEVEVSHDSGDGDWEFDRPGHTLLRVVAYSSFAVVAGFLLWLGLRDPPGPIPNTRPGRVTTTEESEAHPGLSPDGSRIVYSSELDGNADVFVVDARGGDPLRLTTDPARDTEPTWFPDGSSVAFVSDRGGMEGVWRVGQLGGGATLMVPGASHPAVSPDGTKIAFCVPVDGQERIAVGPIDDPANYGVLTGDEDGLWSHEDPAWSPDSERICYAARHDLWLLNTTTGATERLTTEDAWDREPVWSPSGRHVYFSSGRDGTIALWRVGADGRHLQRLTYGTGPESQPTISHDGRRLAYSTLTEHYELVLVDRETNDAHRLLRQREMSMAAISRDGSMAVFTSDRFESKTELWLLQLEGGAPAGSPRRVTDQEGIASHPRFSPDGRWVTYYRIIDDTRDVWVAPVDGGRPERITDHPASDIHPAWSPDGSQLVFVSERGDRSGLWLVEVREGQRAGEPQRLPTHDVAVFAPAWSPDGRRIAFVGFREPSVEAWVLSLDDGSYRPVTSGANAQRLQWNESTGRLWVAGTWGGPRTRLRSVSETDGSWQEIDPPIDLGKMEYSDTFGISADGRMVLHSRVLSTGDIWLLEAEDGAF